MTYPKKEWKAIAGTHGRYEVSNYGEVRSWVLRGSNNWKRLSEPRTLTPVLRMRYPSVRIPIGGKPKSVRIHTLVMEAFVGPRPEGMEVAHLDGCRDNNRIDNLRWCTHKENMQHMGPQGVYFKFRPHQSKLSPLDAIEIRRRCKHGKIGPRHQKDSPMALAKEFGVKPGAIWKVLYRESFKYV